ncbi:HD domain-containing protein [Roseisolibacter sp. H3M3-2]|uniref:HD domain-containing protein n=1 Tax=Roseisolibacter sp. H3M3-2 TaxID=3031323 RepID=UPI0023DCDE10|nr:HD domain-containing protein [Roseisolibacter sp. H3M3-2]MDF1502694.1 HD domain-containing protein [Roseisolibacter sp. H3M3-2]
MTDRLEAQLAFVRELDRLKLVLRRTSVGGGSRRENSAEHSWHLATMAVVLAEHAPPGTDLERAIRMLLVHDVVEIDADDTFAFAALADPAVAQAQVERERRAADRLFGLLPDPQGAELRALWVEFESGATEGGTPTARFAVALDRLQAMLQNAGNAGGTWREAGITVAQAYRRMAPIREGAPGLWPLVERTISDATTAGFLRHG